MLFYDAILFVNNLSHKGFYRIAKTMCMDPVLVAPHFIVYPKLVAPHRANRMMACRTISPQVP